MQVILIVVVVIVLMSVAVFGSHSFVVTQTPDGREWYIRGLQMVSAQSQAAMVHSALPVSHHCT